MRKAVKGVKLMDYEVARNKAISKIGYIVEQYFGISHLHNNAYKARFTTIIKNAIDFASNFLLCILSNDFLPSSPNIKNASSLKPLALCLKSPLLNSITPIHKR